MLNKHIFKSIFLTMYPYNYLFSDNKYTESFIVDTLSEAETRINGLFLKKCGPIRLFKGVLFKATEILEIEFTFCSLFILFKINNTIGYKKVESIDKALDFFIKNKDKINKLYLLIGYEIPLKLYINKAFIDELLDNQLKDIKCYLSN